MTTEQPPPHRCRACKHRVPDFPSLPKIKHFIGVCRDDWHFAARVVWRVVLRVVRVLGGAVLRRVVEVGDGVRREQRVKEREDVAGVLVGCGTAFGDAVCVCVCVCSG